MRTPWPMLALAALCAYAAHGAKAALDAQPRPSADESKEAMPSPEALRLLSAGYRSLAADYYWLRALNHYGERTWHNQLYPLLLPLLERVIALDPDFWGGYVFAGTGLTLDGMDPRHSVRLLEIGVRHRPDQWRIPFLLGFNRYYFLGDYEGGARYLEMAARLPDAPEYLPALATRVAAEAGTPEVGLRLIDALLAEARDPVLIEGYKDRRALLLREVYFNQLDLALARYQERHGAPAKAWSELVAAGILAAVPPEPVGGEFVIGADGHAASTSDAPRLRIPDYAKNPKLAPGGGEP
jgi:hypothetical protein